jgi:hypothetical protein
LPAFAAVTVWPAVGRTVENEIPVARPP